MKVELELWQLITLLLTFLGACAGGGKLLLNQIQKSLDSRFASQDQARLANHEQLSYRLDAIEQAAREETNQWQRVERELMSPKAELPIQYVRREDYIRGQSVIEAKLDGLAVKLENAQLRSLMGAKMQIDLAKTRREAPALADSADPEQCSAGGRPRGPVLSVAQSEYPDATPLEIRRELDYLADRDLVTLVKEPSGKWFADLTRYGTDVAEYTIDCEPGIARPKKYW
ncbi:hypothetical protein P4052_06230 [Pseudomonas aeruginosa]|nr:hypothetical protein [Pseudomonas aeruginosa]